MATTRCSLLDNATPSGFKIHEVNGCELSIIRPHSASVDLRRWLSGLLTYLLLGADVDCTEALVGVICLKVVPVVFTSVPQPVGIVSAAGKVSFPIPPVSGSV